MNAIKVVSADACTITEINKNRFEMKKSFTENILHG